MNQLYYGGNLYVLRDHISPESVDIIYLDPRFNSKRDYNLLFKSPKGDMIRSTVPTTYTPPTPKPQPAPAPVTATTKTPQAN